MPRPPAVAVRRSRSETGIDKRKQPDWAAQIADKGLALGEAFVFNGGMLKRPTPAQHELEMVTLE
ncbi:hypothetical protein ACQUJS_23855, partial [Ralstonia pseudosolanacearum]